MKYYKTITDRDAGFQTVVGDAHTELLYRNIYSPYKGGDISCILLSDSAILTDVLSNGTFSLLGLIVSSKFYNIIKKFNLHCVQFVDIVANFGAYKFMFFNGDLTKTIDYKKSNFKVIEKTPLKNRVVNIDVPDNADGVIEVYYDQCSESIFNYLIPQNGYHFTGPFKLEDIDVFRIGHYDTHFYFSKRVKDELLKNGITGLEFFEQPLLNSK